MHSIYSKIIWEELGKADYKIHREPTEKTEQLIIDWIKDTPIDKVDEVLADISWVTEITDAGYYDGTFHGINQRTEDERPKNDDGEPQNDLVIHDTGLVPSLLFMCAKLRLHPDELRFIAKMLEAYYDR